MKQFLVCGKDMFDIEEAKTREWLIKNLRGNGFKFTVIFSFEQVEKILNDDYYRMSLTGDNYKYANMIRGNVYIKDGKLTY